MKKLSLGGRLRAVGLVLALVPPCYLGTHASGFPEAEGCSGGSGTAPPGLRLRRTGSSPAIDVATDGFFLIDTFFSDPKSIVSDTSVVVTTAEGASVPGALKVFSGSSSYLGWEASAPIPVGTHLKIVLTPPQSVGFALQDMSDATVVGEPTSLSAATLTFGTWYELHHGIGQPLTCQQSTTTNCGLPITLNVYEQEEQVPVVDLTWSGQPQINGFVLWEGSVAPDPEQLATGLASSSIVTAQSEQPQRLGRLGFVATAAGHCATLSVRDLRSGQVVSTKTCGDVQGGTAISDYADVGQCDYPPSPSLTAEWCARHPDSKLPPCLPPGSEHPADPAPTPVTPPNQDGQMKPIDASTTTRTSSACQLSPGPARGAALGITLAALGLIGIARRRRSRSTAAA